MLITNLALGDLLMGSYLLLIALVDRHYRGVYFMHDASWRSSALCSLAGFLSTFSSEISVYTLTGQPCNHTIASPRKYFPEKTRECSHPTKVEFLNGISTNRLVLKKNITVRYHNKCKKFDVITNDKRIQIVKVASSFTLLCRLHGPRGHVCGTNKLLLLVWKN